MKTPAGSSVLSRYIVKYENKTLNMKTFQCHLNPSTILSLRHSAGLKDSKRRFKGPHPFLLHLGSGVGSVSNKQCYSGARSAVPRGVGGGEGPGCSFESPSPLPPPPHLGRAGCEDAGTRLPGASLRRPGRQSCETRLRSKPSAQVTSSESQQVHKRLYSLGRGRKTLLGRLRGEKEGHRASFTVWSQN